MRLPPIYDFNRNNPDTTTPSQYTVSNLANLLHHTNANNDEDERDDTTTTCVDKTTRPAYAHRRDEQIQAPTSRPGKQKPQGGANKGGAFGAHHNTPL